MCEPLRYVLVGRTASSTGSIAQALTSCRPTLGGRVGVQLVSQSEMCGSRSSSPLSLGYIPHGVGWLRGVGFGPTATNGKAND